MPERSEKIREEPKITKKIKIKKSLSDLILAEIWKCSEELANARPAKNPPISMEKPSFVVRVAMPKHHAKLTKKRSSWEPAILLKISGRIFLPK
ncbi:MAG: hypothetical protein DDT18_01914 [Actinobacteria bacterium]|nr:hypothetical protein [Actinomycetota bacterium]